MRTSRLLLAVVFVVSLAACAKPFKEARVNEDVEYISRTYSASSKDAFLAARLALVENGYAAANENQYDGIITTTWRPVTSDSHYILTFGRHDYGVTNSYYQLEVHITSEDGRVTVKVGSRVKTLVANLKSSGIEERKILDRIGDALRKSEPGLTNLGVDE